MLNENINTQKQKKKKIWKVGRNYSNTHREWNIISFCVKWGKAPSKFFYIYFFAIKKIVYEGINYMLYVYMWGQVHGKNNSEGTACVCVEMNFSSVCQNVCLEFLRFVEYFFFKIYN